MYNWQALAAQYAQAQNQSMQPMPHPPMVPMGMGPGMPPPQNPHMYPWFFNNWQPQPPMQMFPPQPPMMMQQPPFVQPFLQPLPPLPAEQMVAPAPPVEPISDSKPPLPAEPPPEEAGKQEATLFSGADWSQPPPAPDQPPTPATQPAAPLQSKDDVNSSLKAKLDEIAKEEVEFHVQYDNWKKQYRDWQHENKDHPNRDQFEQYMAQWKQYEQQMEERQKDIETRKQSAENVMKAAGSSAVAVGQAQSAAGFSGMQHLQSQQNIATADPSSLQCQIPGSGDQPTVPGYGGPLAFHGSLPGQMYGVGNSNQFSYQGHNQSVLPQSMMNQGQIQFPGQPGPGQPGPGPGQPGPGPGQQPQSATNMVGTSSDFQQKMPSNFDVNLSAGVEGNNFPEQQGANQEASQGRMSGETYFDQGMAPNLMNDSSDLSSNMMQRMPVPGSHSMEGTLRPPFPGHSQMQGPVGIGPNFINGPPPDFPQCKGPGPNPVFGPPGPNPERLLGSQHDMQNSVGSGPNQLFGQQGPVSNPGLNQNEIHGLRGMDHNQNLRPPVSAMEPMQGQMPHMVQGAHGLGPMQDNRLPGFNQMQGPRGFGASQQCGPRMLPGPHGPLQPGRYANPRDPRIRSSYSADGFKEQETHGVDGSMKAMSSESGVKDAGGEDARSSFYQRTQNIGSNICPKDSVNQNSQSMPAPFAGTNTNIDEHPHDGSKSNLDAFGNSRQFPQPSGLRGGCPDPRFSFPGPPGGFRGRGGPMNFRGNGPPNFDRGWPRNMHRGPTFQDPRCRFEGPPCGQDGRFVNRLGRPDRGMDLNADHSHYQDERLQAHQGQDFAPQKGSADSWEGKLRGGDNREMFPDGFVGHRDGNTDMDIRGPRECGPHDLQTNKRGFYCEEDGRRGDFRDWEGHCISEVDPGARSRDYGQEIGPRMSQHRHDEETDNFSGSVASSNRGGSDGGRFDNIYDREGVRRRDSAYGENDEDESMQYNYERRGGFRGRGAPPFRRQRPFYSGPSNDIPSQSCQGQFDEFRDDGFEFSDHDARNEDRQGFYETGMRRRGGGLIRGSSGMRGDHYGHFHGRGRPGHGGPDRGVRGRGGPGPVGYGGSLQQRMSSFDDDEFRRYGDGNSDTRHDANEGTSARGWASEGRGRIFKGDCSGVSGREDYHDVHGQLPPQFDGDMKRRHTLDDSLPKNVEEYSVGNNSKKPEQDDLSAIDSHNKDGTPVSNKATLTGKLLGLGDKLPLAFGKGGGLDEDESENPGVGQPRERGVRQFADQAENIGAKEMLSSDVGSEPNSRFSEKRSGRRTRFSDRECVAYPIFTDRFGKVGIVNKSDAAFPERNVHQNQEDVHTSDGRIREGSCEERGVTSGFGDSKHGQGGHGYERGGLRSGRFGERGTDRHRGEPFGDRRHGDKPGHGRMFTEQGHGRHGSVQDRSKDYAYDGNGEWGDRKHMPPDRYKREPYDDRSEGKGSAEMDDRRMFGADPTKDDFHSSHHVNRDVPGPFNRRHQARQFHDEDRHIKHHSDVRGDSYHDRDAVFHGENIDDPTFHRHPHEQGSSSKKDERLFVPAESIDYDHGPNMKNMPDDLSELGKYEVIDYGHGTADEEVPAREKETFDYHGGRCLKISDLDDDQPAGDARLHGAIDQSFHEGDLPDVGRQLQKSRDDVNAGPDSDVHMLPENPAQLEVVKVEDLICSPGRLSRPSQLVVIMRGLPGTGKTYASKLLREKEIANGGSTPRTLSLDDYFMVEVERVATEAESGVKLKKKKAMEYEYEQGMEEAYLQSLFKSFKKTVDGGLFPFIIVDAINDKVKSFEPFWSYAKSKGFQVYIAVMDADIPTCINRNVHKWTEYDVEKVKSRWEETPSHYMQLDMRWLLQDVSITEVEMEDLTEEDKDTDDAPQEGKRKLDDDNDEEDDTVVYKKSKWELDTSDIRLDKLDGLSHGIHKHTSMEDYLQLSNEYYVKKNTPGQKMVRWADLEEEKEQNRRRDLGFVVGQTKEDWERITDSQFAEKALNKTKYI